MVGWCVMEYFFLFLVTVQSAKFIKVHIKNLVWKPTFDVIVSDCVLKSFVFSTCNPKSN